MYVNKCIFFFENGIKENKKRGEKHSYETKRNKKKILAFSMVNLFVIRNPEFHLKLENPSECLVR